MGRPLPKDDIISQRAFFRQFLDNFFTYIKIVSEYKYKKYCKKQGYLTNVKKMQKYMTGEVDNPYVMPVVFQMARMSGLPIGTWIMGDIQYLHKNGIIIMTDDGSFHIGSNYLTDGVYFYSKHIDHAVPLGTNPEFQKLVDECFDLRVWKYRQPL